MKTKGFLNGGSFLFVKISPTIMKPIDKFTKSKGENYEQGKN